MKKLLSGNEAVARGFYEAGGHVATAYPGTPSTEILENMPQYGEDVYSQWSPNEKVALEVGIGSSFGGARTLVAMKHVGVNVAADPLLTLTYSGVKGGFVLVSSDDPGMHSSQNEQDNRFYAKFAKMPLLEPSDSQEAKDFVARALKISEEYDTPVMLRLTTRISHTKTLVELKEREEHNDLLGFEKNPPKYVMVPANGRKRHPIVEERTKKLKDLAENIDINKAEYNDKSIGIITSSIAYQYVKEVFPEASVLKLGMAFPFPINKVKEFAEKVEKLYVVEELEPFMEEMIKAEGIEVTGKDIIPRCGELNPKIIKNAVNKNKNEIKENKFEDVKTPIRPPVLCPGCPHRGVFYTLNKLNTVVTGDIGCYTLGVQKPLDAMDSTIAMGASIGVNIGLEKALGKEFSRKSVAVIGDSTFLHSGTTGLMDAVYNKGTNTIIILDNRITAMTGRQDNPSTGYTLMEEETKEVDFEKLAKAIGVERVKIVDSYDLNELKEVISNEIDKEEVSVIITKRPCMLIRRREYDIKTYRVDEDKCINCGLCLKVGCPAVIKNDDETKAKIVESMCTGCSVCAQVCPQDAIKLVK
ncbi:MAG: indolepyruvate ferredoxin oxidoreductase subunit alpha [Candidatus Mcinerneyibacterium aminivorans]|uniref:Indolepyruvate oxidoreductase subunit IorA n=1 Tax=Candidatus Mcinerneyibacterium aminivorans TaxID=2703815 RepID=A0A5D0MCV6_9BACT|nr:MAG: indolepyruvate ferredoxin oxidoreductase subunit alpha [Candidatus Mcinerneyibacterium aminivorans]